MNTFYTWTWQTSSSSTGFLFSVGNASFGVSKTVTEVALVRSSFSKSRLVSQNLKSKKFKLDFLKRRERPQNYHAVLRQWTFPDIQYSLLDKMRWRHKFEFVPFITDKQELWRLQQFNDSLVGLPVGPKILEQNRFHVIPGTLSIMTVKQVDRRKHTL